MSKRFLTRELIICKAFKMIDEDGALSKSFSTVYNDLKNAEDEDAKETASPPWMNGITYANIDTIAVMVKDNTAMRNLAQ